jgi:hypothetical protein
MIIGATMTEYKIKYISDRYGVIVTRAPNIQPMCVIEEYARILRSFVWFRPRTPPIRAFIGARMKRKFRTGLDDEQVIIRINGASFCHVIRISEFPHLRDDITLGNQK